MNPARQSLHSLATNGVAGNRGWYATRRDLIRWLLAGAFSRFTSCRDAEQAEDAESTRPAKSWRRRPAAELGLDERKLKVFTEHVGGNGCITRRGWLVHDWGHPTKTIEVASAGKPVVAHFLYRAVDLGLLPGLDCLVMDSEPRLRDLNARLGYKDRDITWRHLLQQTACYGSVNSPGSAFDYNDLQMAMFWRVLMFKVYRTHMETVNHDVLLKHLTRKIGLEDRPCFIKGGNLTSPGHLKISARDFCRFGLLYARGGKWRESEPPPLAAKWAADALNQPLPASLPKAHGKADVIAGEVSYGGGTQQEENLGCYSNMWWINGVDAQGRRTFPDLPHEMFSAVGQGGTHVMAHLPSTGVTVAWTRSKLPAATKMTGVGKDRVNHALSLLLRAVR